MAEAKALRRIGIRWWPRRRRVCGSGAGYIPLLSEAQALTVIGEFLGSAYRGGAGRADPVGLCWIVVAQRRGARSASRSSPAVSSSRWAGAITRAAEDQYQLGMRRLAAHVTDLRRRCEVLERGARCARANCAGRRQRAGRASVAAASTGYRSAAERFAKTRRLAVLRPGWPLASAPWRWSSVDHGGREAVVAHPQPPRRRRYDRAAVARPLGRRADVLDRRWRVWQAGRQRDHPRRRRQPVAHQDPGRPGRPVRHASRDRRPDAVQPPRRRNGPARVAARQAVRYDISYDPGRGRWYLDASWSTSTRTGARPRTSCAPGRVLGVDLNADHLACCVLDASGNPVGEPVSIEVITAGLAASRRDGRVRAAITALLDHAQHNGCAAIVIENLDFADARATGRETLGRGKRGKRLRRTVAGIPTAPVPGSG